jgi:uncharacterized protein (UPF0335 family)
LDIGGIKMVKLRTENMTENEVVIYEEIDDIIKRIEKLEKKLTTIIETMEELK